ncbi:SLAP domain-containing protein [Lactobacillus amylovorus]|uniref:SLAP domain-containing protein n=1 Tax=Lactobacillus amylovorus TaxID=1604 RepID=UPI0022DF4B00|nr:SLAP domain-containing protein [Lactobacillus amylovorus]
MKKNLRIVSAAAAALLAVAPVAATAVNTVSADVVSNLGNMGEVANNADVKVSTSNVVLNAANKANNTSNSISGSIVASVNGQSVTGNLDAATDVKVKRTTGNKWVNFYNLNDASTIVSPKDKYDVSVGTVSFNVGATNANKKLTVSLPSDITATTEAASTSTAFGKNTQVTVDQNGYITLYNVVLKNVNAYDLTNAAGIYFASVQNGTASTPVTTGSLEMTANSGKLNVNAVVAAASQKYDAYQNQNGTKAVSSIGIDTAASVSNLKSALKAMNLDVNPQGFFDAPKAFTFNLASKSNLNAAAQTLPVTVSVPNGKDMTPAAVPSTGTVKIMHAAYTYELKDGKLTRVSSADTLHAYSEVPVYGTTTVNGKKYYRVSGEHEWYINAGNVDGTSRTLNHNSYVYNNKGKRVKSEGTWKKGSKHTTYGAAMNIKGNRMYRVNKNRYVKVVNFD